jgi:hypothetical protein
VCICGLAEVLSLQITNQQSFTFAEGYLTNNLRICDSRNLFAARPPLLAYDMTEINCKVSSFFIIVIYTRS